MRDYARISPTFWTRGTGKRLRGHKDAQILAQYVMTAPASNMSGIYYLPLSTIANDTGLTPEEIADAFVKLHQERFAAYDLQAEIVWVPGLPKHQLGEALGGSGDKRRAGVVRELRQVGQHPFVRSFVDLYRQSYGLPDGIVSEYTAPWNWGTGAPPPPSETVQKAAEYTEEARGSAELSGARAAPSKGSQASSPPLGRGRADRAEDHAQEQEQEHAQGDGRDRPPGVQSSIADPEADPEPAIEPSSSGTRLSAAVRAARTADPTSDGAFGMSPHAFREGISSVTGRPCSSLSAGETREVTRAVEAHGAGRTGEALLEWVKTSAAAFAEANDPKFGGYTAKRWRTWLDAGGDEPTALEPRVLETRSAPPPGPVVPAPPETLAAMRALGEASALRGAPVLASVLAKDAEGGADVRWTPPAKGAQ